MRLPIVFAAILLLFSLNSFAVLSEGALPIYAVISEGQSALAAELHITIEPGTGRIYSGVGPLVGTSTQSSERAAVELAANYFPEIERYDFKFDINSDASIVDGPSAGSAMALLLVTMLEDRSIPKNVAITGTINLDGLIGPVGGVFEKAQKAQETGIDLFMIPAGESLQTRRFPDGVRTVDLTKFALEEWGLKVIEVQNLDQALKLAFQDIGAIDVETYIQAREPEFIPEAIPLNSKLLVMRDVTSNYLDQVNSSINSARGALSQTILTRKDVVNTLLASLNSAEQSLDRSRILLDQNYLYSSANTAFLAMINAFIVEDISQDPALLEPSSVALQDRSQKLLNEIKKFSNQLDKSMPADSLEWYVSAQERLSWARLSLEQIDRSQVVIIGNTEETDLINALDNLRKYEFARAWLEVSRAFYGITLLNNGPRVKLDELFRDTATQSLIDVQNLVIDIPDDDENEDVYRRLNAAVAQQSRGWNVASAVDAVSARALIRAKARTEEKTFAELVKLLDNGIAVLEGKMVASGREFVWPQLYLDHAKYFLNAARFYEEQDSQLRAVESVRGGITLIFLADEVFGTVNTAYDDVPNAEIDRSAAMSGNFPDPVQTNNFPLVIIPVLAFLAIIAMVYFYLHSQNKLPGSKEAPMSEKNVALMLSNLDKAYAESKITEKQYGDLSNQYKQMLSKISSNKIERSHHIIHLDRLKAELSASQRTLHELKRQYVAGQITQDDYEKNLDYYKNRIQSVVQGIDSEKQVLQTPPFVKKVSEKQKTIHSTGNKPVSKIKKRKTTPKTTGKFSSDKK